MMGFDTPPNPMLQLFPTWPQMICYDYFPVAARTLPCLTTSQGVIEWVEFFIGEEGIIQNKLNKM